MLNDKNYVLLSFFSNFNLNFKESRMWVCDTLSNHFINFSQGFHMITLIFLCLPNYVRSKVDII